jgi:hypothetical protein
MIISGEELRAMSRRGLPLNAFLSEMIGSGKFPTGPEPPGVHHAFPTATSTLTRDLPPFGGSSEQETYLHISPEPEDGQETLLWTALEKKIFQVWRLDI